MSPKLCLFLVAISALTTVVTADIFGDLLGWDIVSAITGDVKKEGKNRPDERKEEEPERGCECQGMGCNCCVDFNLTSIIDLGGPGCVRMKYISKDEGVAVNVSYGDSLLHSQTVKQKDKKGSCMDLLSEFAQICAKFSDLKETDDGLQGCLNFEPHVLGEVTSHYPVGCFRMGPNGMVQDQSLAASENEQSQENEKDDEEDTEEDAPSILSVVNQSAEQGIAFISDLFGFKIPGKKVKPGDKTGSTTTEAPAAEEEEEEEDESGMEENQEESRKLGSIKTRLGRERYDNDV